MAARSTSRGNKSAYPTLSLSSTPAILLLAALFPQNTSAQDVSSTFQTITTNPAATPTSGITESSATSQDVSLTSTASPTPLPTNVPYMGDPNRPGFSNYYTLLIVVIVILALSSTLWYVRRRRIQKLIYRHNQARALSSSHDVGGIRSPRYGRGWGWPTDGDRTTPPAGIATTGRRGRRGEQVEGLNERGEAPPPYTGVGSKPPSLRSEDGISGRCDSLGESARSVNRRPSDDVELGNMTRPTYEPYVPPRDSWRAPVQEQPPIQGQPPAYDGEGNASGAAQPATSEMATVARPQPAVTRP